MLEVVPLGTTTFVARIYSRVAAVLAVLQSARCVFAYALRLVKEVAKVALVTFVFPYISTSSAVVEHAVLAY